MPRNIIRYLRAERNARVEELASKFGYSNFVIGRYVRIFGYDEARRLAESSIEGMRRSIRINRIRAKGREKEVIERLEEKGIILRKIGWLEGDIYYDVLREQISLGATTEFLLGYYYVQSSSSLIPPIVLDPKPGDLVCDMCASPGGKTTHLADLMMNEGAIVALEIQERRIQPLILNLVRMGVRNAIVLLEDATRLPELGLKFDKILLDAPCTGNEWKNPERKRNLSGDEIERLSRLQLRLLDAGVRSLESGGCLVYSTCTLNPEENEIVIDRILGKYDDLDLEEIELKIGKRGLTRIGDIKLDGRLRRARRVMPYETGSEPFFIARIIKY